MFGISVFQLTSSVRNKYEHDQAAKELVEGSHKKQPMEEKHGLLFSLIPKCDSHLVSTCLTTKLSDHTDLKTVGSFIEQTNDKTDAKDTCVVYRPNKMKESDSGMFLLTSRHSSSSDGSPTEPGTRFRQSRTNVGGESYV